MNTCGGCSRRWTGWRIAHCGSCHESFSTVANFDRHRHNGKCTIPKTLTLGALGHWIEKREDD